MNIINEIFADYGIAEDDIFSLAENKSGYECNYLSQYTLFRLHDSFLETLDIKGKNCWTCDKSYLFYTVIEGKLDIILNGTKIKTDNKLQYILQKLGVKKNEPFALKQKGHTLEYNCRLNENWLEAYMRHKWKRFDPWFYELLRGDWEIAKIECPYGKFRTEEYWVCEQCFFKGFKYCDKETRYSMMPTAKQQDFENGLDDL